MLIAKMKAMLNAMLFFAALSTVPGSAQQPLLQPKVPDVVWTWSKSCDGKPKLAVKVQLKNKTLYRGVLPICKGSRDAEDGKADFRFRRGYLFQGAHRTGPSDEIEGDIWQAGGESDGLLLGISFATKRQVLLNTLHFASLGKRTSSKLDRDIFFTTYPVFVR